MFSEANLRIDKVLKNKGFIGKYILPKKYIQVFVNAKQQPRKEEVYPFLASSIVSKKHIHNKLCASAYNFIIRKKANQRI